MLIPVAVLGLLTSERVPPRALPGVTITFSDPLLIRLIAIPMHINLNTTANNPFYFAAWIGLLVTSLNLLPVGLLDGGHASMAVFGEAAHRWLGRAAFVIMLTLTTLGWFL